MEIRRITVSDMDDFILLWNSVYEEGKYLGSAPPPKERLVKALSRVEREQIPNFVVHDQERLIASVEVFPGSMCGLNTDDADLTGMLGIMVDKDHRGKGIGRKLLETAIEDCRRFGYKALSLMVYKSNTKAIALYESLGFEYLEDGVIHTLPSGDIVTSQKMGLQLEEGLMRRIQAFFKV
ncbi:GNAT family N-acetyltransferase [Veronia nyctiphanis]|uniref:GNAT family N-acetyltransferase n=1 Tax=Veronia nyctiphanis TaxID=1278244 RepID=A0A4V1LSK0_9GAMM|nr:GNAT family N-acetyltransferase [Veronia nyctiphanis]RXJ71968.1 GNAT family N-acetyltransferase [Veronia nyctiphanis]